MLVAKQDVRHEREHVPSRHKIKRHGELYNVENSHGKPVKLDGLWKSVLGDETSTEKISKAKAKIVLSLDESLYIHVAKTATAQEAWQNLQKAFQDTGFTQKIGLLRKMTTTKLETVNPWKDI